MTTFLPRVFFPRLAGGLRAGLTGALLLAAPLARAQGALDMGVLTNTLSIPADRKGSRPPARKTTPASMAYTPTPALRRQTVQAYADQLRPSDPTTAQVTLDTFGPGKVDYGQVYRTIVAGTGLRENDAADALAAYMLVGWAVINDARDRNAITPAMAKGLRAQTAATLGSSATFTAPGRAARLGEELKLQTVILQYGWEGAIKGGRLPEYRQRIARQFRSQYNLDMGQLKLTSQGLGKK